MPKTDHIQTIRAALDRLGHDITCMSASISGRRGIPGEQRLPCNCEKARSLASLSALQEHVTTLEWAIGAKDKQILEFLAHEAALQEERERMQAVSIEAYLIRQWEWSRRTFGDGYRMEQIIAHIQKELAEIEANPADRIEWIDVALLALDGYNRCAAGTAETIMADMQAKQDRNFARVWVKSANPRAAIEHDRSIDAAIGEPAAPSITENVNPSSAVDSSSGESEGVRQQPPDACQHCVEGTIGETDWTGAIRDRACPECGGTGYQDIDAATGTADDQIAPAVVDVLRERIAASGLTNEGYLAAFDSLTPQQIATAMERMPTDALEFGGRFEALSAASGETVGPATLRPGDVVTCPSWDAGHAETIKEIVPGPESVATFESGGFWRVSRLVKFGVPICAGELLHDAQQLKACGCPHKKALEEAIGIVARIRGSEIPGAEPKSKLLGRWKAALDSAPFPCEFPAPPALSWEYIGEELAIFWHSPYGHGKERIASFWWPVHPPEATADVEAAFEGIAAKICAPSPCEGLREQIYIILRRAGFNASNITDPFDVLLRVIRERDSLRAEPTASQERERTWEWAVGAKDKQLSELVQAHDAAVERGRVLREALERIAAYSRRANPAINTDAATAANTMLEIATAALATPEGTPE